MSSVMEMCVKRRFEIQFESSVIDLTGNNYTVIIVVDDTDFQRFDLWDPERGILVNLSFFPDQDQAAITNLVALHFADRVERHLKVIDPNFGREYVEWINGGSR